MTLLEILSLLILSRSNDNFFEESITFFHFTHIAKLKIFFFLYTTLTLAACVQSNAPESTELIPTLQPLINGLTSLNLTSSSSTYTIAGTCDTKSYGTEYSINNGTTWTDLGSCSTGNFSFTVVVPSTLKVFVRSKTKFAYTNITTATIRYILAPTSPFLSFVSSGLANSASLSNPTMNFTMPSFSTGKRSSTINTYNMDLHPTGITYGP